MINIFIGAWMKVYMEKTAEFFSKLNVSIPLSDISNIYGPYDNYNLNTSHFMAATIKKVIDSKNVINVWGDGTEKRDLLYVNDLCDFIDKAIKRQKIKFRIYNVGLGKAYSIKSIVKKQ